jgi:hypothetical protein
MPPVSVFSGPLPHYSPPAMIVAVVLLFGIRMAFSKCSCSQDATSYGTSPPPRAPPSSFAPPWRGRHQRSRKGNRRKARRQQRKGREATEERQGGDRGEAVKHQESKRGEHIRAAKSDKAAEKIDKRQINEREACTSLSPFPSLSLCCFPGVNTSPRCRCLRC